LIKVYTIEMMTTMTTHDIPIQSQKRDQKNAGFNVDIFRMICGNALTQTAIFAQFRCTCWIKRVNWRRWKLYKGDWRK